MLIAGVDEAGRGPAIGSLFIAGVLIDKDDDDELRKVGVKDSKLLTEPQRERIKKDMMPLIKKFKLIEVPAKEIDEAVESKTSNLNWLEADKTIEILAYLKPEQAYIDCPSNNIKAYRSYLEKGLAKKGIPKAQIKLIVEHKADETYASASAASIIAKVAREEFVASKKKELSVDFGSGYPSDPRTQDFLAKNWQSYPGLFRKSWACYKKIAQAKEQTKLGEY